MGYPDQVSADLARYEHDQAELDRLFDPADLSEVDIFELTDFIHDLSEADMVKLVRPVREEDWEQFGIEFREMLIESRRNV